MKAHWSLDAEDAVLALGISFDAMLTEKSPSPGRVHAERFALLGREPTTRKARYRKYQSEFYAARSAVAHGGRTSSLSATLVREMASEARKTFDSILRLVRTEHVTSDGEYDDMFDNMKWGVVRS